MRTETNVFTTVTALGGKGRVAECRQSRAAYLHLRNPGTQVAHDHFTAAYPPLCRHCNALHKALSMEAIAMDLLDSVRSFHMLLGRRGLSTSRLHDIRAI